MSRARNKIYYVIRNGSKILESFSVRGYGQVLFTALLYRNGKKLNSIENASAEYFGELMRNYDKSEEPDKIKLMFYDSGNNSLLWSKEFLLSDTESEPTAPSNLTGLGEIEINEIIGRKIEDYRQIREIETLRTELEELTAENEELTDELKEVKTQLESKKQIEYYAGLLGIAMPGLADALKTTQVGSALGFLSGTSDESEQIESPQASDSKTAIIQLVNGYMLELDEPMLEKFYLHVYKFGKKS